MMVLAMLSWWYTTGWVRLGKRAYERIHTALDTFSVGLLMRTLFAPFRQISAGSTSSKSMDAQMRALGDKLFSRVFGAFVRSIFIIIGSVWALVVSILGLLQLLLWPLTPALPVIGLVLMLTGWKL